MRYGNIEKEELWKTNIRRLEKLNQETQRKVLGNAKTLANSTSLTKDTALKLALDLEGR